MPHDRLTTTWIISTYLIRSLNSWNHEFRALESEHRASLRNAHGMFQSCYIVLNVVYFRIFGILPTRWPVICLSLLECNAVRQTSNLLQEAEKYGSWKLWWSEGEYSTSTLSKNNSFNIGISFIIIVTFTLDLDRGRHWCNMSWNTWPRIYIFYPVIGSSRFDSWTPMSIQRIVLLLQDYCRLRYSLSPRAFVKPSFFCRTLQGCMLT